MSRPRSPLLDITHMPESPPVSPKPVPSSYTIHPAVLARMLMGHYDRTYDLTGKAARQRSLMYLLLVALVFGNVLLMAWPDTTTPLLFQIAGRMAGLPSLAQVAQQGQSLSLEVLQTLLLVAGFLVTANLFRQNVILMRNYRYLAALEHDLKLLVDLPRQGLAFTRASDDYLALAEPPERWLRRAYSGVLAALLLLLAAPVVYTAARRTFDSSGVVTVANLGLLLADLVLVGLLVALVLADARSAARFDPLVYEREGATHDVVTPTAPPIP